MEETGQFVDSLESLPVALKQWTVGFAPEAVRPLLDATLTALPIMAVFGLLFALTTVIERKGLGRIQNRRGPNRVGPAGFLQWAADGLKILAKEDIVPRSADKVIHYLAPLALVVPVYLAYSVIPFGKDLVAIQLDAGLLFFFAVGAGTELAVFMAGWSSRNKYALLGAMRAIAQMLSYELPLLLSTVAVIMAAGTLSLPEIVRTQTGGFWNWYFLTPWGLAGGLIFLAAAAAESNRSPFDIPEAESEIIAGYFVEYSGFKFALFFLGEYLGLFVMCSLGITLFLGGWDSPLPFAPFTWLPSYLWFLLKLCGLIGLFIWMRGTLPRLRIDQLMNLAWKFMLPMALLTVFTAGLCRFIADPLLDWIVGLSIIAGSYMWLGRSLTRAQNIGPRTYRFAD